MSMRERMKVTIKKLDIQYMRSTMSMRERMKVTMK